MRSPARELVLLATGDGDGWELWRLNNHAEFKSRGGNSGVAALAFGSWQGTTALLSGAPDGWLRVWSQNGAQVLGIDIDEPVTAVAFLPEDGIAVGTRRGVVILRLTGHGIGQTPGPLEAKVASLRVAVREQRAFIWNWRNWTSGIFPPTTPGSYNGPVAELVELIAESPAETFRPLSSWLGDDTPLASEEKSSVADVACALIAAYSHAAFDDLCEVVADAHNAAGAGSRTRSGCSR